MSATHSLYDLPLGSRFRYVLQGVVRSPVYVLLSYEDYGLIADEPSETMKRPFQGIYSAAESRAGFVALRVELVNVREVEGGAS